MMLTMLRRLPNAGVIAAVLVGVSALSILDGGNPQTLILTVVAGGVVVLALDDPVDEVVRPRLVDVVSARSLTEERTQALR